MATLEGYEFMFYCSHEHPSKVFREQCQLLRYAVSGDAVKFKEYIDKLLTRPNKNFISFYPGFEDKSKVEGMDFVGTILDGGLYLG